MMRPGRPGDLQRLEAAEELLKGIDMRRYNGTSAEIKAVKGAILDARVNVGVARDLVADLVADG